MIDRMFVSLDKAIAKEEKPAPKKMILLDDNIYIDMEKAVRAPIGTVSNGRKKVAEGKWVPVSGKEKPKGKPSSEPKDSKEKPKDPKKKKETVDTSEKNKERVKNALKKMATVMADLLSGKDAVDPAGRAVEDIGERNIQKEKIKKKKKQDEKNKEKDKKETK